MIIKELLLKAVGFIKEKAAAAVAAIAGVSMMTVAKFAVAAGVTIGTAIMVIKFFKDKFEMLVCGNDSMPIERNLDRNYYDYRKRRTLHREMKEVSKNLWDDTPRRGHSYGWMDEFEEDIIEDDNKSKKAKNKKANAKKEYENFMSFVSRGGKAKNSDKNKSKKKNKSGRKAESFRLFWDNCKRRGRAY